MGLMKVQRTRRLRITPLQVGRSSRLCEGRPPPPGILPERRRSHDPTRPRALLSASLFVPFVPWRRRPGSRNVRNVPNNLLEGNLRASLRDQGSCAEPVREVREDGPPWPGSAGQGSAFSSNSTARTHGRAVTVSRRAQWTLRRELVTNDRNDESWLTDLHRIPGGDQG